MAEPTPEMSSGDAPGGVEHSLRAQISRAVVHLLKELYGRGPVKARTYYMEDVVVIVLTGGFSKVEETLEAAGQGRAVSDQRAIFQTAMGDRFIAVIEELTGRKVISLMSANDQAANLTSQLFVLESRSTDALPLSEDR